MPVFENTSPVERTWSNLTDSKTGRTVHLAPGDTAEIEVPDGFDDPFLKPVDSAPAKAKATKSSGKE